MRQTSFPTLRRCAAGRRVSRRRRITSALVALLIGASAGPAWAGVAGWLDTTFGGDGRVTALFTPEVGAEADFEAVAIQPDRKIVVAGTDIDLGGDKDFAVARYLPNGSLDPFFSQDGKVTTSFRAMDEAHGLAIQPDGKIIVVGEAADPGEPKKIAVARYTRFGRLDTSFSGDGKMTACVDGCGKKAWANAVYVAKDRIFVAGGVARPDGKPDWALARFAMNGAPDTGFGEGGWIKTNWGGNEAANSLWVDAASGEAVAVGRDDDSGTFSTDWDWGIARYKWNGRLDPSFDGDGKTKVGFGGDDEANDVTVDASGRIVVVGQAQRGGGGKDYDFGVARLNPDGRPDTSFSEDGKVRTDYYTLPQFSHTTNDVFEGVSVQADGKIVAAGFYFPHGNAISSESAIVARYRPTGQLDTGFDGNGIAEAGLGRIDRALDVALQPNDGKIVIAGMSQIQGGSSLRGLVARLYPVTDRLAPDTLITGGPAAGVITRDSTPTFSFRSTEPASTFQCQVDSGAWASCTSPVTTPPLADGPHTFRVRATDRGDNTDTTPAMRSFTVDTTPPDTQIDSGPTGTTNNNDPSFGFSANEAGSSFECRLDGPGATTGSFAPCSSPKSYTNLPDGTYTFNVRATDSAGNTDATPETRTFTVNVLDNSPPETSITGGPAEGSRIQDATPTFSFESSEPSSTFECQVDELAWVPCASPYTTPLLSYATHTFRVRATDPAGNTDPTPATRAFQVSQVARIQPSVPLLGIAR